mgnify:FL=1
MEVVFIIVIVIGVLITWEIVKYSNHQKQINERDSSESSLRVNQPRKKSKSSTKATKVEAPHHSKSKRTYKKKRKSIKKKKDE